MRVFSRFLLLKATSSEIFGLSPTWYANYDRNVTSEWPIIAWEMSVHSSVIHFLQISIRMFLLFFKNHWFLRLCTIESIFPAPWLSAWLLPFISFFKASQIYFTKFWCGEKLSSHFSDVFSRQIYFRLCELIFLFPGKTINRVKNWSIRYLFINIQW